MKHAPNPLTSHLVSHLYEEGEGDGHGVYHHVELTGVLVVSQMEQHCVH